MSDPTEQAVIERLTAAIADVEELDPERLEICLHNHVSTDAIRDLAAHESNAWRLQFETRDHVVEVTGNNVISVDGQRVRDVT